MSADAGSRAPARRRPLNVRVAVLLALALALLAASFRLSSTSLGSCGGAGATATATRAAATTLAATSSSSSSGSGSLQPQPYEGDPPDCEPPQLDRGALLEYGCQIDELACFDQNVIIRYDLPPDANLSVPYYDFGWTPSYVPGYGESFPAVNSGAPGGLQALPLMRRNSSADRPDLREPAFSRCHVPLIWASPWHQAYGEWVPNTLAPLWHMQAERMFDRRILLVPAIDGYEKQAFVDLTLAPFSTKPVVPLHELGSRARAADPSHPRCFQTMVTCQLRGLYYDRPSPKFQETADNGSTYFTFDRDERWWWFEPAQAGRSLVDYYRRAGQLPAQPDRPPGTLNVLVSNRTGLIRRFIHLDEFLKQCNAWKPPGKSGYKRARCRAHTFGSGADGAAFLEDVRVMTETDIFLTHHGSECVNGWFMPAGSSLVEVRMKGFRGRWPDTFARSMFRQEDEQLYWMAQVVGNASWRPALWETKRVTDFHYIQRDRHTVLRWRSLRPLFERILSVGRDKEAYRQLAWDEVRWEI